MARLSLMLGTCAKVCQPVHLEGAPLLACMQAARPGGAAATVMLGLLRVLSRRSVTAQQPCVSTAGSCRQAGNRQTCLALAYPVR